MASIDTLRASDGSGNASIATIQSVRSPLATTIVVDTVQGINATFHATMGTPHTFVDPITSETITVISETTAVDFQGHVDGGNLEIDTIAPGFVDNGSAVSDIVIIKPTTQWADNMADVLEVTHNDDGTLKNDIVTTSKINNKAVTGAKIDDNTITSDNIDFTTFIGFRAYQSASLTITSSYNNIPFNTEIYDEGSNFNNSTGIFTAPVDGIYIFSYTLYLDATATARAFVAYRGTVPEVRTGGERGNDVGATRVYNRSETINVVMKSGETFGLRGYSATNINVASADGRTSFSGRLSVPLPTGFIV